MVLEHRSRYTAPDPQRMRETMEAVCDERGLLNYMSRMWSQVLASGAAPVASAWHDRWGELQLPYLPLEPERFGVALGPDSEVLDVGCLSGYGLYDLYRRRLAAELPVPRITGVDNDAAACDAGRRLARLWADEGARVRFIEGDLAALPIADGVADVVIARCVLAYVDLATGLRELRRVLRPRGLAVIQVHGPRYYSAQAAACMRSPARFAYYVRPLMSGAFLAASGRAPRHALFRETALTAPGLISVAQRSGLAPVWSHATRYRPLVLFRAS